MGVTPDYRIIADSEDVTATIRQRFTSLRITDQSGVKSDAVEIVLADHNPAARLALPRTGAELDIQIGYTDALEGMGLYVVDSLELSGPPDKLVIRAKALVQSTQTTQSGKTSFQSKKTRSWDSGMKLGDLTRTIAQEHGVEGVVVNSLASILLPHQDQTDESDISFLHRLVEDYDGLVKLAAGRLVLTKRSEGRTATGKVMPAVALAAEEVTSWRVSLRERNAMGAVVATWRDADSAETKDVKVGAAEPVHRLKNPYKDEATAREAAASHYNRSQRGKGQVSITLPGDTRFFAEGRLVLSGFRTGVNGEWLIEKVEHSLTGAGFKTSIRAVVPKD